MEEPLTNEELEESINQIKLGKAPEPDGLTAKFYKMFKKELTPWLKIVGNDVLEGKNIPKTWQHAIITMIPKQQEDCPNVKNFRPISLLNNDYKIFTKTMAERLKKILNGYIKEDQAGFLPNHHIRDNVRTVVDMIEYGDKVPGEKIGLFFLDTEKAFDNVDWEFYEKLV